MEHFQRHTRADSEDPGSIQWGSPANGVADVHCDQRIYLDDPQPAMKKKQGKWGRNSPRLEAQTPAVRVDEWMKEQAKEAWKRIKVRDSTCGELEVDVLRRRVWLWDGEDRKPGFGT